MYSPDQLIPNTPDINDLHIRVGLQVATQFGDKYIQAACIEETVIAPNVFEDSLTLDGLILVLAKQF